MESVFRSFPEVGTMVLGSTFHQLLKSIRDPWFGLPSAYSTDAKRRTVTESVINFYNSKRNFCMVLATIYKKSKHVATAHIYLRSEPTGSQFFDLNSSDIDNPTQVEQARS
jgi:hypothetical protein